MQYLHLARTGFRCPHWPALPALNLYRPCIAMFAGYCIIASISIAICSIEVIIVDDFERFDFFYYLRLTICQVVNLFFSPRHENSYLLFHSRISLILLILLIFKRIVIVLGVKAWYFYYGICSLAMTNFVIDVKANFYGNH